MTGLKVIDGTPTAISGYLRNRLKENFNEYVGGEITEKDIIEEMKPTKFLVEYEDHGKPFQVWEELFTKLDLQKALQSQKQKIIEEIEKFFKRLRELPTNKVFDTATTKGRNVFYEFIENEEKELLKSLKGGENES